MRQLSCPTLLVATTQTPLSRTPVTDDTRRVWRPNPSSLHRKHLSPVDIDFRLWPTCHVTRGVGCPRTVTVMAACRRRRTTKGDDTSTMISGGRTVWDDILDDQLSWRVAHAYWRLQRRPTLNQLLTLNLRRRLLSYGYSYKTSCARPG